MKLFKRLLAVALIGVMALTVLAGCTVDPDTVFESDTICQAYDNLTNKASDDGYSTGTYSRKLSSVAKAMYSAISGAYGFNNGEYSADCDKAAKAAFAKAVTDGKLPAGSTLCVGYLVTNPASYGSFDYKSVYTDSGYEMANTIGLYYNGSNGYLMIVAAYIPASK